MELMLILRVILRRWWLVVIPIVIVGAFVVPDFLRNRGASGGYSVTVRYSASQVLSAIPGRDGDFQDVWLASELAVNAMTDWVRTSSFVEEIQAETERQNITINPALLGIAADNKRSIGQLTITYPDQQQLQTIINVALDVLKTRAQNYFPQLGGQPAQVTILDVPQIVPAPPPITDRFAPVIRLGLALILGVGLAFLAEYLDPVLRRREQVEALGIGVVGTVPRR
jgi:capsular polysaccharide biosynthesis protein